ncbi:MOSC domain-containing protein [Halocatena halophila]|uniref:MOSC domain-containing protein n=1 Tax=Halocatena halophila TaxID=2814576 RepID=UPI002ED14285
MQPTIARLDCYPVKSLDAVTLDSARLSTGGGLKHDRAWAIVTSPAGEPLPEHDPGAGGVYCNGKQTPAVHRLRSTVDLAAETIAIRETTATSTEQFSLDDTTALNAWLSDFFEQPVSVRRTDDVGYFDDQSLSGPTVISTATLETVASWFDDINVAEMRRRFRANIEIGGVSPFWEDRLFADHGEHVAFRIGDVAFEGHNPCQRCVVPTRNPDTGEPTPGFRETFIRNRKRTLPEWVSSERFDHAYRLMVNTRVPESEWEQSIAVDDPVEIIGIHSTE